MMTRPGCCRRKGGCLHTYKKQPREQEQLERCQQSRQTGPGMSARAWCGSGHRRDCRRVCRKGIVTLPAQKVSLIGDHPPRRSLAMLSTWRKPTLTRMDVATQTELP